MLPHPPGGDVRAHPDSDAGLRNPFGSLRVSARIGRTEWKTSLFADTKANAYLLPVKADVRKQERLAAGDLVAVEITVNP